MLCTDSRENEEDDVMKYLLLKYFSLLAAYRSSADVKSVVKWNRLFCVQRERKIREEEKTKKRRETVSAGSIERR